MDVYSRKALGHARLVAALLHDPTVCPLAQTRMLFNDHALAPVVSPPVAVESREIPTVAQRRTRAAYADTIYKWEGDSGLSCRHASRRTVGKAGGRGENLGPESFYPIYNVVSN